jgi:hypothetical protein
VDPKPLATSKLSAVLFFTLLTVACGGSGTGAPLDATIPGTGDAALADGGDEPHAIDAAPAPPDGPTLPTCPSVVPTDPHLAERQACAFGPGSLATATTGLTEAQRAGLPIKHVIVVMKENRSFDHMLGGLQALQPDAETFPPGYKNKDRAGHDVLPFRLDTTCVKHDPDHQWQGMHKQ